MSSILNALRKSERQRHLGEPPRPGMSVPGRPTPRRRRRGPLLGLLVIAGLLGIAWLFKLHVPVLEWWRAGQTTTPLVAVGEASGQSQPAAAQDLAANTRADQGVTADSAPALPPASPPVATTSMPAATPEPEQTLAEPAPGTIATTATPDAAGGAPATSSANMSATTPPSAPIRRVDRAPGSMGQPPQPAPGPARPEINDSPQVDTLATQVPTQAPTAPQSVELPGERIPHIHELPLATRQSLPDLDLNVHVYHPDPEQRFVLINMVRYGEGDTVGSEVYVEHIDEQGVALQYREALFRLTSR